MRGSHLRLCRSLVLAAVAAGLAACGGSSASTKPTRIEFGIAGGNIAPYRVTIEPTGRVRASGSMRANPRDLSRAEIASLSRLVRNDFSTGLTSRRCRGTNPDFASRFIRAENRTVTVHGSCEPRFERLWNTLARSVGIGVSKG